MYVNYQAWLRPNQWVDSNTSMKFRVNYKFTLFASPCGVYAQFCIIFTPYRWFSVKFCSFKMLKRSFKMNRWPTKYEICPLKVKHLFFLLWQMARILTYRNPNERTLNRMHLKYRGIKEFLKIDSVIVDASVKWSPILSIVQPTEFQGDFSLSLYSFISINCERESSNISTVLLCIFCLTGCDFLPHKMR